MEPLFYKHVGVVDTWFIFEYDEATLAVCPPPIYPVYEPIEDEL